MEQEHEEHGIAHHGAPILTQRDVNYCLAMSEWIRTARKFGGFGYGPEWLPGYADICKSRLFWRLRSGKKPLPSPPPTAYSCPWYELIDEPERPHWAYEVAEHEGRVYVAQSGYELLERGADGLPAKVGFGPWVFRCWKGPSPYNVEHSGWWIQLEPSNK